MTISDNMTYVLRTHERPAFNRPKARFQATRRLLQQNQKATVIRSKKTYRHEKVPLSAANNSTTIKQPQLSHPLRHREPKLKKPKRSSCFSICHKSRRTFKVNKSLQNEVYFPTSYAMIPYFERFLNSLGGRPLMRVKNFVKPDGAAKDSLSAICSMLSSDR